MARRKLNDSLTENEHEAAIIRGYKAEESIEDIYHVLRRRLGARHPLTLKAERAMRRINDFRHRISNLEFE